MSPERVRVLTGRDRYADPWHPFAETSEAVAALLRDAYAVEVATDAPEALGDLAGVDLLVVNAGIGADPAHPAGPAEEWTAAFAACERWLAGGGRVLGVHTAANAFKDWPAWPAILGGEWLPGTSMHPARGPARFDVVGDHPITRGLTAVEADDESYSFLEVADASVPLLDHAYAGTRHVMAWASRTGHAAYCGLGHDARAYASPDTQRVVRNCAAWLLRNARDA